MQDKPFRYLIKVMSRQKTKIKSMKRQKDKETKIDFDIVMSGQFCTLAMFLNVCLSKQKMMQAATGEHKQAQ